VPSPTPASLREAVHALDLRDWQVAAFTGWVGAGCRGTVEAVTAAGKTRVGLAAVAATLASGGRALVLAPTVELQDQWTRHVRAAVPGSRIGRLGGGRTDDLDEVDVLIATPQSAADLPIAPPHGAVGLLVADEAHRYGAPTWAGALKPEFAMRLALTATLERTDDGVAEVLTPYFGPHVATYGYAEARRDGIIAPLRLRLMAVELSTAERARYEQADRRARELRARLVRLGLPRDPQALLRAATAIAARDDAATTTRSAGAYLAALRERRATASEARAKLDALEALASELQGTRSLVFTDTVDQADAALGRLHTAGIAATTVHGGLSAPDRTARVAGFHRGRIRCVVSPRVLDEGIDVPDADAAVVLAAFRAPRQLTQRLGRVLRPKPDGRAARFTIVYARDTREDPAAGAHAAFLEAVTPIATSVDRCELGSDSSG
jgi:superfamily II DNA or RNA helicase